MKAFLEYLPGRQKMPKTLYKDAIASLNAKALEMNLTPFGKLKKLNIYADASGVRPGVNCALYLSQSSPKRDEDKGVHQFQVVIGSGDLEVKSLEEMIWYIHDRAIQEARLAGRPKPVTCNGLSLE